MFGKDSKCAYIILLIIFPTKIHLHSLLFEEVVLRDNEKLWKEKQMFKDDKYYHENYMAYFMKV